MSNLNLAVIAAVIVGGVVWIESRHRIVLDASTPADLAAPAAGAACPDREGEPYSASCLAFMGGDRVFGVASRETSVASATMVVVNASQEAATPAIACPDNDNVPYTDSCLRFLSGRYWRPNSAASPLAPVDARR